MGERAIKSEKKAELESGTAAKALAEEIAKLAEHVGGNLQDDVKEAKEEVAAASEGLTKAISEEKFATSISSQHLDVAASAKVKMSSQKAVATAKSRLEKAKKALVLTESKLRSSQEALSRDKSKVKTLDADAAKKSAVSRSDQRTSSRDTETASDSTRMAKAQAERAARYTREAKAAQTQRAHESAELGEEKQQLEAVQKVVEEDKRAVQPL